MAYLVSTIMAGVLWGLISIFLHALTAAGLTSIQVMLLRGILSVVIMLVFLLIKDRSLLKIQIKDLWMFIGTGVVSLTFFSLCYFKTILEVGTSIAVVLLYTSPIFVLIMSVLFFKEKINLKKIIALIMTFAGCILVAGIIGAVENRLSAKGFFIGMCAGFGYALYSIFSRFALKKYNSLTVTFYTFVFSSVSLLPFVHVEQIPGALNFTGWIYALGISLFCTVLPYILYTYGLTGLDTGKAAIVVTVEPLVGTLVGFFIWHESLNIWNLLGIMLIFISIVLLALPEKSKEN